MKIYVQSRGLEKDYNWVTSKENNSEEISDNIFIISRAINLIDAQDFSVVLLRLDDKLLLLVTGLLTQRQDINSRKIRNSIAWIGKNENEPQLRQLAALALKNELEPKIDEAINNYSGRFEVNWNAIKQLIADETIQSEFLSAEEAQGQIAINSKARKQELAEKLMKYRLPNEEGALVIVTGIKSKEALEADVIWRGLSSDSRIQESWQHINKEVNYPPNDNDHTSHIFCQIIQLFMGANQDSQ
ncbi:hypothetical protein NIES2100_68020 [Calothrix sp. NIES-2100]|uniref:hypothetical protein n=1 Tax=Calothrix sp. NIES-2100 TaxID=1954172 RepID=UPI000B5DE4BC|nr:hypothetical protein NIES2100_68020 [Calothrix sp. NIES-2100]